MDFTQSRLFRMYGEPKDVDALGRVVADLRHALFSAIQDIAVLKSALADRGLLDDATYKKLRMQRMVADHSSAGVASWRNSSSYPYTLDEDEFLRDQFHATDDEVRQYEDDVRAVQVLT
jgi:hypothetical protein